MKKIIFITSVLIGLKSFSSEEFTRVIKDETHATYVELDTTTVRCSAIGYGMEELKVSLPSLKWNAILDHSNRDGLGPCITAGTKFCSKIFDNDTGTWSSLGIPDVLIDPETPTESINVRVVLNEDFRIEDDICFRSLRENVTTVIRGVDFTHVRSARIGQLPAKECLSIFTNR